MQRWSVWLLGECDHPDLAASIAWLRATCHCSDSTELASSTSSPDAIVIVQSRPGSVSEQEVESLHRRAPLARLVHLSGTWCDGELRSGRPIRGIARIRWHEWRWKLPQQLGLPHTIGQPRTATENDRLESELVRLSHSPGGGTAQIRTLRRATHESLADACLALRWNVVRNARDGLQLDNECDCVLIDGWENLSTTEDSPHPSRTILVLDFPRPEDVVRAAQLGIDAVIARPLLLTDLAAALQEPSIATGAAMP